MFHDAISIFKDEVITNSELAFSHFASQPGFLVVGRDSNLGCEEHTKGCRVNFYYNSDLPWFTNLGITRR